MKKNNNRMMVALVALVVIFATVFVGCASTADYEAYKNAQTETVVTETPAISETVQVNCNCDCNPEELANQIGAIVEQKLTVVMNELEALRAENDALMAENEALKAQIIPAVEVIDGVVYCDIEYFMERATVTFADGTSALMAIEEGTSVVLDDIHALNERGNYRDNIFEIPMLNDNIAITFDGEVIYSATANKENELVKKTTLETGYELVETEKDGKYGDLMKFIAVCKENKDSEYGYDFYVIVIEEVPVAPSNPGYKPTQPQQPEIEEPKEEDPKEDEPEVPDTPDIPDIPEIPDEPEIPDDPEEPESDHNDLEDIPDPNEGEGDSEHNDLEEVPNPNDDDFDTTLQPEDDSNDEGDNVNQDDDSQVEIEENDPADIIPDDEVIDTTLMPEDPSNDEGAHSSLEEASVVSSTSTSSSESPGSSHSSLD